MNKTGKDKKRRNNLVTGSCIIASLLLLLTLSFDVLGAEAAETAQTTKTAEAAKPTEADLFAMSLEQLMDVGVYAPATITEKNPLKTPACVTTITAEDIAVTPARNILDLMEIYVPGMLYVNHSIGPVPGIRGIIADRPYKFLINVNGMNVNIKSYYGARLELLNWELSDIDRIEVIRGPGSVTYGPGAIAGVINIYTKKGKKYPGFEFGGQYWNRYDSVGNYFSYGRSKDDFDLYTYLSITDTEGVKNPDIYGAASGGRTGYLGEAGSFGQRPVPYMTDYFNQPQIKAHLDIQFNENWRFWGRYVTANSALMQYNATQFIVDGSYKDVRLSSFRYFQLALENTRDISDNWVLKSTFGMSSIDVRDIQKQNATSGTFNSDDNSKDNLRCYGQIFSEWEYFARFMLNYDPKDGKLKGALGLEVSYDLIRPAWGKGKNNGLRMSDAIISGPDSDAYGTGTGQVNPSTGGYWSVGQGWETLMYSLIGELNYQFTPQTTMIVSGRFDVHSYTTGVFSPRFALIHELKKDHYLKFIAQKSVRLNTQEELLLNNKKEHLNVPETLETLELIYSGKMTDHLFLETSLFFNRNETIGWDSTLRSAASLGTLRTIGLDIDLKYKKENYDVGINHSFVKQIDWQTADKIEATGISYSDYYFRTGTVLMGSKGNNLNNWSNHITKFYTNIDFCEKKLTLHGDARVIWGFEGSKEGLENLNDALVQAGGNAVNVDTIKAMNSHHIYDTAVTANLSLTYHINKSADLTAFLQGIPVIGDNKRYAYSSGFKTPHPEKASWVEEPMVVGFKYKIRF
jgi:outer membrane receptor protein involved in Fe transport